MNFSGGMDYLERLSAHRQFEYDLSEGKIIVLHTDTCQPGAEKRIIAVKDFSAAILRHDPRCFVPGTDTLFLDGNCYLYAKYNKQKCYAQLGLKLVCGRLGFGTTSPRWFEYGKPMYITAKDFMGGSFSWDWHVWLEDEDGRVWDVLPGIWHTLAHVYGRQISLGGATETRVIEGLDKEHLMKHVLEYVPAQEITQSILFSVAQRVYTPYFKALHIE